MLIEIGPTTAIGPIVRASPKAQSIRRGDAAGSIGVGENFLGKLELALVRGRGCLYSITLA